MKPILRCLLISIVICSCKTKTSESNVINDVISYNASVLNKKISDCFIMDDNASCGNKTEAYIIECTGSENWFKWDRSNNIDGKTIITIYTIPNNFDNYHCNPELNYKKQFKAHKKTSQGWIPENYTDK
ncbi:MULTISPECIES: hypothetical protein [Niastella]|uniref:Lipoprotein n=1 Tax=Niastella soli TaxID=2821487 RepID=A0ABS3YXW3_9BACT|nr:hypothetical protein [Niastella soli]MBO9202255.1 hypothetical protein [Niastella soli]